MSLHRAKQNKPIKYLSVKDTALLSSYEDKSLFVKVINEIFKEAKDILLSKFRIKMEGIGVFEVINYKSNKKLVDFGNTKKLGYTVYYTNFHTNRMVYKIKMKHSWYNLYNKFVSYRFLDRDLNKKLKEDE